MELCSCSSPSVITNQSTVLLNKRQSNLSTEEKSSVFRIQEEIKKHVVKLPSEKYKKKVMTLEKDLFSCFNLKLGVDIISEDISLLNENNNNNYYIHLIRTANPDPNKNNFFLIHGIFSSYLHFICILPYLIKRYNVFIPDTIGMGLSARPQIRFTSSLQCEEYFINIYHIIIKSIFFKGKFNIKKNFYLCGHSLGGFFASRYSLRYPMGVKKLLLLSPAGITDFSIPGTSMNQKSSFFINCLFVICPSFFWPCKLRIQNVYRCCCCHNLIKKSYGKYEFKIDEKEIPRNLDGTEFKVDTDKIASLLRDLTLLSLDYPDDIYECAYYLFGVPPPAAILPIERALELTNKIPIIFVYGEKDWMESQGALRLSKYNPKIYKKHTVSKSGHSFAMENPEELCTIIGQYFEE